ncbi:hypothetical protein [Saccharobesus litoralis]|uniref:hypothetical protein n=1 Tax=Saccharobesus litoralis TaxID=2172099 RepID=UPI00131F45A4|nr:hypothetical protein [Saccharobesus litoralis]
MFDKPIQLDGTDFKAPDMPPTEDVALESVIGILKSLDKNVEELKAIYQFNDINRIR